MDDTRFDALTRSVVAAASRRAALRLLGAGLLGAVLPGRGVLAARAAQRSDVDEDGLYDDDESFVYGTDPNWWDTDGDGSGDGEEVYHGTNPLVDETAPPPAPPPAPAPVTCAAGLANCNGTCSNLMQDPANCGLCGWDCGDRNQYFCYLGVCVIYCPVGSRRCTGEYHCRNYPEPCPA